MSGASFAVTDREIAGLLYLKENSKIARYLDVPEDRVARVRELHSPKPRPEPKQEKPAITLPEPLEKAMEAKPLNVASVHAPDLCPTCGSPVGSRLMIAHIQALVAAYYKISIRDMTSQRRNRSVARPRQVAMYLAYELTKQSLPDIARRFDRDHTTVMHAVRVVPARMLEDPELDADVCALRERLAA